MAIQERERQAVALRLAGASYPEIARQVGYRGPSAAYQAVHRGIASPAAEDVEEYRELQRQRLERLFLAWWQKAIGSQTAGGVRVEPDEAAANMVLKIHDRLTRILGLDREPVVDFEAEVRAMARERGLDEEEAVAEAESLIQANARRWAKR